jgi:hypothetical protein
VKEKVVIVVVCCENNVEERVIGFQDEKFWVDWIG